MKNIYHNFFFCISALLFSGCATQVIEETVPLIPLDDIYRHNGKKVRICGWLRANMEDCSLSKNSSVIDPAEQIWLITDAKICQPENAILNPTQKWAEIVGTVAAGRSYGHLGLYSASISVEKLKLLNEPCTE